MKPSEYSELINKLKAMKWKYHQKVYADEVILAVYGQRGGQTICGFWSSNQDDEDKRLSVNLRRRMLRAGIIQTTRERGLYRIVAGELDTAEYGGGGVIFHECTGCGDLYESIDDALNCCGADAVEVEVCDACGKPEPGGLATCEGCGEYFCNACVRPGSEWGGDGGGNSSDFWCDYCWGRKIDEND